MTIKRLNIEQLRNHKFSIVDFCDNINVISGLNGSGKTTILESVAISSLSKTFLPTPDSALIMSGEQAYKVSAIAESDVEVQYKVNLEYKIGSRKKINSTLGDNLNPKDIIGIIPVIVLSPDFKSLTFGAPQDKRQFLDLVLSQSSKLYSNESIKLRKYLKQRNALLSNYQKTGIFNKDYFEILTDMYIKSSSEIIYKRISFINDFKEIFRESYNYVSNKQELTDINYNPDSILMENSIIKEDIIEILNKRYNNLMNSELKRGSTLFGPHRDDVLITINNLNAKDSASQGQHKSLLVSLKLAEFEYLRSILNETPIILFDDIFSELDSVRSALIVEKIKQFEAQTIITMTDSEKFIKNSNFEFNHIEVENGKIRNN